jgi:GT2 family glycosyltransferase
MTVHVLMPVFNRLEMTRSMLEDLRSQQADEPLSLIVIDDGSSDGTADYLRTQPDVIVLQGDGSLWWGGAIDLGLRHVLAKAAADDWVLFVNNDTHIGGDFVQALLTAARQYAPSAVGGVVRHKESPHRLIFIGPLIDAWRLRVTEAAGNASKVNELKQGVVTVDALSGRGVIYPVSALRKVRGMRPYMTPHYFADYELAVRVQAAGWRLLVSSSATVYSANEFGSAFRCSTLWERAFSIRSPSYLPAWLSFWWSASSFMQRVTLPLRMAAFLLRSLAKRKL